VLMDERLEFADALNLNTGAPATFNLGDVIDTHGPTIGHNAGQNVKRDLGVHNELYLVIMMQAAGTSGGGATGQFRLVSDDVNPPDLATATIHFQTGAVPVASMGAGAVLAVVPLPSGMYERYVGIQQITAGAAFTGGSINAFLTADPSIWRAYADNVS